MKIFVTSFRVIFLLSVDLDLNLITSFLDNLYLMLFCSTDAIYFHCNSLSVHPIPSVLVILNRSYITDNIGTVFITIRNRLGCHYDDT